MTTTDDPIRAEVERALRGAIEASIAIPIAITTAIPRCLVRRACALRRRLAEPLRIARSLLDLVGGTGPTPPPSGTPDRVAPANRTVRPLGAADSGLDVTMDRTDELPIEEYESLAASQVVDRLATLTPDELEAIRSFELANRSRRTVLGRIDQLVAR
jgi:hypothetical protein